MDYNYSGSGNPPLPPGPLNPPPPPPPPQMPMGMNQMMQQGPMMGGPMNMMPQNYHNMPMQMMQGMNAPGVMSGNHHQAMHMLNNPGMNDAPLEFNMNKNKPPMPIISDDRSNGRNEPNNDDNNGTSDADNRRDRGDRRGRGDRRDRDRDRDRERRDRDQDRDRRDRDRREERDDPTINTNAIGPQMPQHNVINNMQQMPPNMNNSPNTMASAVMAGNNMWGGMMGPMGYPMMGMNLMGGAMMGDPNMMNMGQYGMMPGMMPDGSMGPMLGPDGSVMPIDPNMQNMMLGTVVKEKIKCKSCILFPPKPNTPQPTTRERPPGCRTVFVGGLPESTTEEIIDEIFSRCGEMSTVRLSKKNFCHIRFVYESSVEAAIYLSGYHVRIGDDETEGNPTNSSRLHVDYAQARDDLYEWECRQRALQREMRHRERVEKERMRPPSPPPVVHYTEHEAANISEKLKGTVADESFTKAVQVVITWLDRGDCVKRNANTFYTMIQSTNSHIRRLLNEKAQFEEELQRARDIFKGRMQGILIQFGQIERVFSSASHKKVWDHFTKAQRKNIEMWKKQTAEIKTVQLEEVLNERADEEMEVSDSEDDYNYGGVKKRRVETADEKALASIKEENDSLRCQLEAYKNEVDLVRVDSISELEQKDKQIKMLQQTLQGMQQQLMDSKRRQTDDDTRVRTLEAKLKAADQIQAHMAASAAASRAAESARAADAAKATDAEAGSGDATTLAAEEETTVAEEKVDLLEMASPKLVLSIGTINDKEARLIGLISTFLNVHPFGAGVDYIWSYVQKMEPLLRPNEVESLMSRFPLVFRETLSGIGANMERRWQFSGFEP